MGKIVQVEPLPVDVTVSGYKLVCAGVPPAPAAQEQAKLGKLSSSLWKKLLSLAGVPRTGPGSDLGTRTHLRNLPYPRQKREFW